MNGNEFLKSECENISPAKPLSTRTSNAAFARKGTKIIKNAVSSNNLNSNYPIEDKDEIASISSSAIRAYIPQDLSWMKRVETPPPIVTTCEVEQYHAAIPKGASNR